MGKENLRAHFPAPFPALSSLLFSEKKPGDLPSRQIIIELWLLLFDLFPTTSIPRSLTRPSGSRFDSGPVDVVATVRSLLAPAPDPAKEPHDFFNTAHRPRIYKAWVGELSDICRDYFW